MHRHIGTAFVLLALGIGIGATPRPNIAADPPKNEKIEKPIPLKTWASEESSATSAIRSAKS
jgi:hypothetical protein